ncbi:hypothetical protein Krac_4578 [Ktedonobacter racemifer DSM 44963]|uniref:Uncharacterized protein n=1 Tax=Ktedonobacter racemifer DSM 44963 TaxID=485913 RepID=D6TT40_KTERA|nr:hypothetical protein Krac_4578 [Ktedonobacter racemifer DSM 44963]
MSKQWHAPGSGGGHPSGPESERRDTQKRMEANHGIAGKTRTAQPLPCSPVNPNYSKEKPLSTTGSFYSVKDMMFFADEQIIPSILRVFLTDPDDVTYGPLSRGLRISFR